MTDGVGEPFISMIRRGRPRTGDVFKRRRTSTIRITPSRGCRPRTTRRKPPSSGSEAPGRSRP